ncbi:MAG: hypothetical protein LBC20_16785 [Planctomycetaceae bacterium]|jgi:hypothetical protein|nr:hypothetical protein [Planctomycetaceae bacterium]
MTLINSGPDWKQFGSLSDEQIENDLADDNNSNIDWFHDAIKWKKNRLVGGPPENYVPILTANLQVGGQLGFLVVTEKQTYGESLNPSELESHAYKAAKIIFDLFKPLYHSHKTPLVEIHLNQTGCGNSLSLPAIIAALQLLTGIVLPNTVVSTGCLENNSLTPVNPDTLVNKIEVAKRFGYKTLLTVKGQKGINNIADGIEIIEVDSNPLLALFDIIKLATNKDNAAEGIACLLAAYSNRNIRDNLKNVEAIIFPFTKSESNLVRHVAYDLLSRAALHNGETEKSANYRQAARILDWDEIPTNNLGHYLRYEQSASCSVLAVDSGEWDDIHYSHQEVDKRISHLQDAINGKFADADDYLSLLAMLNTRALRRRFLARLNCISSRTKAIELLKSAWNDLTFLKKEWTKIWNYASKIDRRDTAFERQRNYCLECLADYKRIANNTDETLTSEFIGANEFLDLLSRQEFSVASGFDFAAWVQYRYICNRDCKLSEKELNQFIEQVDRAYQDWRGYPNFLAYELLLRYRFVDDSQKEHCLAQLQKVKRVDEPTSIETLLALRTRQFLLDNGYKVVEPITPPENTPLRKIYDDLISDLKTLMDSCPY